MKNRVERLGPLDFILAWIAASLAVYSAGVGVGVPEIGYLLVGVMAVGALFSCIVERVFRDTWLVKADGALFAMSGLAALTYVVPLNRALPENGFPPTLVLAAALCWMLAFWSFSMWRDGTLLFPCVPAVALFSLVGSWDSFSGATFAFFGFLLSFATLFARSQRRGMAYRARESGYIELDRLRLGPWKWMAGPEWALASAAVVVLISLLGAPVIQLSVQGVAGFVKITGPTPRATVNPVSPTSRESATGTVQVGQGPRELSHAPVMWATMDSARYLRAKTYDIYTGKGWRIFPDFADAAARSRDLRDPDSLVNLSRLAITDPVTISYSVEFLSAGNDSLPIPGEVEAVDPLSGDLGLRPDGTLAYISFRRRPQPAFAKIIVPSDNSRPGQRVSKLQGEFTNENGSDNVPLEVVAWAREKAGDSKNDVERAMRLKSAIEEVCVYNLNAAAIPSGRDAVSTFLFHTREGYCDLFASAMTVVARSIGLPARYVQGYLPTTGDLDPQGRYIIYESDYHAWCEILLEGTGWTVFDATEGARAVEGGERGRATLRDPFYKQPWFGPTLFSFMAFAAVAGFGLVWRNNRVAFLARGPRAELAKRYDDFASAMERASGRPRRLDESPRSYFEVTKHRLGTAAEEASLAFENLMYGEAEPSAEDYRSLNEAIRKAKQDLRLIKPPKP